MIFIISFLPNDVQGHKEYYQAELDLNAKLRTFAVNCSLLYGGHNTVQAQLKYKSKRRTYEIASFSFLQAFFKQARSRIRQP